MGERVLHLYLIKACDQLLWLQAFSLMSHSCLTLLSPIRDKFIGAVSSIAVVACLLLSAKLQIGARNMQNFTLLKEVGKLNKPVLLK
ncbi:MAG: hypothetical protein ACFN4S_04145, partial [Prevotella conceptionensis]